MLLIAGACQTGKTYQSYNAIQGVAKNISSVKVITPNVKTALSVYDELFDRKVNEYLDELKVGLSENCGFDLGWLFTSDKSTIPDMLVLDLNVEFTKVKNPLPGESTIEPFLKKVKALSYVEDSLENEIVVTVLAPHFLLTPQNFKELTKFASVWDLNGDYPEQHISGRKVIDPSSR